MMETREALGIGGKELADRFKAEHPDIKAMFLSGYTDNITVHHGVLNRGVAFFHKLF